MTQNLSSETGPAWDRTRLFLVSFLILFLQLACIRWFPAHVLFLTFFTNSVLLGCFLGMSIGCLLAKVKFDYLRWTPQLLLVAMLAAYGVESYRDRLEQVIDAGQQSNPQLVFFGAEYKAQDLAKFAIPVEVLCAFFFIVTALVNIGPGQELGRAFARMPGRVQAYSINIFGSLVGIAGFALLSWLQLTPVWWFLICGLCILLLLLLEHANARPVSVRFVFSALTLGLVVVVASLRAYQTSGGAVRYFWSPYYRIEYAADAKSITVNQIGHQFMLGRDQPYPAYALPHLLHRDAGGKPFEDVLIIGAGSGNDVSRALQWGARSIDAVEIDPVIRRLGQDHPDHPYDDPRVHTYLDDGRNFLHATDKQYDLIVYALVDSLVLQSSYSNIRLESYLFTEQAFADVKRRLKPGGTFVMYNFFRQPWILVRLKQSLANVFETEPVVMTLPYMASVNQDSTLLGHEIDIRGYAVYFAGETKHLQKAFAEQPAYYLKKEVKLDHSVPNGFVTKPPSQKEAEWERYGVTRLDSASDLRTATDDWPFVYLRRPMIPDLSWRGIGIMGGLSVLLVAVFLALGRSKTASASWMPSGLETRMFFLGAGFMLIETRAVVHLALLFGGTWMINTLVFFSVLLMILLANMYVLAVKPQRLLPYFFGLFLALALNVIIPLDAFLGMNRVGQVGLSCALVFTPMIFAGVIFPVSFQRAASPERVFGANILGAMLGGLAENSSMWLGFRILVLVAASFYLLAAVFGSFGEGAQSAQPASGTGAESA